MKKYLKNKKWRCVNNKLGQTNLISSFERELENCVDTEDEVSLVNYRSSFSDAIGNIPTDSSM